MTKYISSTRKQRWKRTLYEKQEGRCALCGGVILGDIVGPANHIKPCIFTPTLDHICRVRDGGKWQLSNLQLTHHYCNQQRN